MSKLQDVLLTAVNEDAQAYEKLSNAFRETVSPLLKDLDALFEYYKGVYIPEVSYRASKGQKFIKNACGMTLNVTEWSTRSLGAQRKTLFPFLLQGTEAAFIHHLTLLGETYSYEPIANEHDGLITIGPIPEQAVEQARALSGFHYAELEIKPFVEQSDRYPLSGVSSNAS
jgi:hypothetical protein